MSSATVIWEEPLVKLTRPEAERAQFANLDNEDDFAVYAEAKWRILTRTRDELPVVVSKAAGIEDITLDSPNWFASRMAALRERRFERTNDPRRRRSSTPL